MSFHPRFNITDAITAALTRVERGTGPTDPTKRYFPGEQAKELLQ